MLKVIEAVSALVVVSGGVLMVVLVVVDYLINVADKVFPLVYDAAELRRKWRGWKLRREMARQKRRARQNADRVRRRTGAA